MELTTKRKVRIEASPFVRTNLKLKMSKAKVNSAGQAIKDSDGNIKTSVEDAPPTLQIPGTAKTITPPLTSSGLKTGLNVLVDNPYNDEDIYYPTWGEKILKGKSKVLLQHLLEYKHQRDFNYYSGNIVDRIEPSSKENEMPFFQSRHGKFMLDGNVTFLDLTNPNHEVWYYVLKAHPSVAASYADLQEGRNRTALYFMVDDVEMGEVKMNEVRKKTKAAAILEELKNEPGNMIIKMAKALENNEKSLTPARAFTWLYNYYQQGDLQYTTFVKYYDLFKDAARRDQFMAAALLQEYMDYNIIRKREGKYFWLKPETDTTPMQTFEWGSKEKIIKDFILAPEYAEELAIVNSIYESRKN